MTWKNPANTGVHNTCCITCEGLRDGARHQWQRAGFWPASLLHQCVGERCRRDGRTHSDSQRCWRGQEALLHNTLCHQSSQPRQVQGQLWDWLVSLLLLAVRILNFYFYVPYSNYSMIYLVHFVLLFVFNFIQYILCIFSFCSNWPKNDNDWTQVIK